MLTTTQNIAQRGHQDSENVDNRGNFLAILELRANHHPIVEKKMNGACNARYAIKSKKRFWIRWQRWCDPPLSEK